MSVKQFIKNKVKSVITSLFKKKINAQIITLGPNELLVGKVALITGGTSGIGKAISIAFLNAGASVIITGRNEQRVRNTVLELKEYTNKNRCCGFVLDNQNIPEMERIFNTIVTEVEEQKIDILVNNAGISIPTSANLIEDEKGFDQVINTNLKGTYFLSKIVARYMIQNHIQGNILNIASTSSNRPATNSYSLSKWGIKGLTIGLAKQLIEYGIVVNGIAPGPTVTPMMKKEHDLNISLPNNPSKRYVLPEEVANMAVILTSDLGRMIVGDTIFIGGGSGIITIDDIKY